MNKLQYFFTTFIKPMKWFWILTICLATSLYFLNTNGYRLFSSNNSTWSNNGQGYHK